MKGKPLVLLGLALLFGLGAMYGTSRVLSKGPVKTVRETQDVLVAVRDLKAEEVLKPDLVKVVTMSKENLPPGTFTSVKDVEERWVQIKILADEPIVDRKLAAKGSPAGMIARIPEGMRAFTLEVNEQTGIAGFVLPDHRVDVVQIESGNSSKSEAETILQDVLVLASGQVFSRPEERSIQSHSVTLAVTPDQVDVLVAAKAKGSLSLSLRGINDHKAVAKKKPEPPPVVLAVVDEPPPMPPTPPAPLPPPAEEPKPAPAPAPVAEEPKPAPDRARFVTIYRGIENSKRVRLDGPESDEGEPFGAGTTTAAVVFPAPGKP